MESRGGIILCVLCVCGQNGDLLKGQPELQKTRATIPTL